MQYISKTYLVKDTGFSSHNIRRNVYLKPVQQKYETKKLSQL